MTVLFVVPYVPDLIRVRPYQLIRGLAGRGHQVILACPASPAKDRASLERLAAAGVRTIVCPMPALRSLVNCLGVLPARTPLQAVYSWHPALARRIETLVSETWIDAVHVEHLRGVRYGLRLRQRNANVPLIWDSVDCISRLFLQARDAGPSPWARWIARLEFSRTAALEATAPRSFDRVLFTSPADRQAVEDLVRARGGSPCENLRVLTNGVDLDYFSYDPCEPREPATIVMTGKMSYHANIAAAKYLIDEVMPLVWQTRPDARVVIAGKNPPRSLLALATARVAFTGSVPDMRPYLRKATVAVAPIVYGAGIQNKILEAMACGAPVVTSMQGVTALRARHGYDLLVSSGAGQFARHVVELLENPDLRSDFRSRGRRYVERHHGWDVVAAQLERIYLEAMEARRAPSSNARQPVPAA